MPCQAMAHRYVGKGKERVLHTGPCVLEEVGHDGEHLPASLAMAQAYDQAFNTGIEAMKDAVREGLHDRLKMTEAFDDKLLRAVLDDIAIDVRR